MPKFKAYIEREDKNVEVSLNNPTIKDLLIHLKINPVEVIVTINNEVSTEEEAISPKDTIKIISVVSGG